VWKIACFFLIMLLAIHMQPEIVGDIPKLFHKFGASFSPRNITEVRKMFTDIRGKLFV
jgi:hypothetical protein